jgi:16S rRNA processing protein RimM
VAAESFSGLTLARVVRPWGRRGEVAADVLTDFPQRLTALKEAWLCDGRNPPRPVSIRSCRMHIGQAVIHFAVVDVG